MGSSMKATRALRMGRSWALRSHTVAQVEACWPQCDLGSKVPLRMEKAISALPMRIFLNAPDWSLLRDVCATGPSPLKTNNWPRSLPLLVPRVPLLCRCVYMMTQ